MIELIVFFLFCIMCMLFVITCILVAAAYFVCKITRQVKHPYVVGEGTHSLQRQTAYLKKRMQYFGYPVVDSRDAMIRTKTIY